MFQTTSLRNYVVGETLARALPIFGAQNLLADDSDSRTRSLHSYALILEPLFALSAGGTV